MRIVDGELINLLRDLRPDEWDLPTIAPLWKVRHVAAHLLDTSIRKLSMVRDSSFPEATGEEVVDLVNRLNREGVRVYGRLSPGVLIDLLEIACEQSATFHESLDPFAQAVFNVSWAGEEKSLNWFDTARELTERWHHQQQIRLATNRPGMMTAELYHPVLDCFMRGLPHRCQDVDAAAGTVVLVEIVGECGGKWALSREPEGWRFVSEMPGAPAAQVLVPESLAWRLFTKGIDREEARTQVAISGDRKLGEPVLSLTAIIG